MSKDSAIEWTDHTFNPWWGCVKVSDGCKNCYAETFAKRVGQPVWGPAATTDRRLFGSKHWQEPEKWNAAAEKAGTRPTVFCASMADVFEDHPSVEGERRRLFDLIARTRSLTWQLLTKRPENVMRMVPESWQARFPSNVWMGTSTEHQAAADERIPHLLRIPAVVRWLSCEPLLGPIDLSQWLDNISNLPPMVGSEWVQPPTTLSGWYRVNDFEQPLHWVIAGGESGPRFRQMSHSWARGLRDQCTEAGVAFFFKQVGGRTPKANGRLLDGRIWDEFPVTMP